MRDSVSFDLWRDIRCIFDQRAKDLLASLVIVALDKVVDLLQKGPQADHASSPAMKPVGTMRFPAASIDIVQAVRKIARAITEQQLIKPGVRKTRQFFCQLLGAGLAKPLQVAPIVVADETPVQVFVDIDLLQWRRTLEHAWPDPGH